MVYDAVSVSGLVVVSRVRGARLRHPVLSIKRREKIVYSVSGRKENKLFCKLFRKNYYGQRDRKQRFSPKFACDRFSGLVLAVLFLLMSIYSGLILIMCATK